MTQRICVFCGSSPGAREEYVAAARHIAEILVARKIGVVYGGGNTGLMAAVANAAMAAGGEVIGVMPRAMVEKERANHDVTQLRIVGSMHERKALMSELSDAFIALPGGYGTFEEFCEVLTWTQLGFQRKPCGILNVAGYYDRLLEMFDHAVAEKFVKPPHRDLVISDDDPERLVERMLSQSIGYNDKWVERSST
jgi:uncharacterized protein (TIGR00730 family)